MSFEFNCQACGAKLRIDDELAGKTVKCPKCSAVVPAKAATEPAAGESPFSEVRPLSGSRDDSNPYASPASLPEIDVPGQADGRPESITPGIRVAMSQTRPWVLFLSVLGFIAAGFMALAGIGVAAASLFGGPFGMLILGPMYLLYAALYLGCSYYLFLYGSRIGSLLQTNSLRDLETALVAQKSFWKLVGILVAVMFVLSMLMMGGFLLFGILAGMNF